MFSWWFSALGCGHLSNLLQVLPSLVSLELAFTRLDDMALSAFSGTSLRHLNIRETKVDFFELFNVCGCFSVPISNVFVFWLTGCFQFMQSFAFKLLTHVINTGLWRSSLPDFGKEFWFEGFEHSRMHTAGTELFWPSAIWENFWENVGECGNWVGFIRLNDFVVWFCILHAPKLCCWSRWNHQWGDPVVHCWAMSRIEATLFMLSGGNSFHILSAL